MLLTLLAILALAFSITTFILKRTLLSIAAAGSWLLVCFQTYITSDFHDTGDFDIYTGLALFAIVFGIIFMFMATTFTTADKKSEDNIFSSEYDGLRNEMEGLEKERESMDFLYRKPKRKKKPETYEELMKR